MSWTPTNQKSFSLIGAGFMGSGIAAVSVLNGYDIRVWDSDPHAKDRFFNTIHTIFTDISKHSHISPELLSRAMKNIVWCDRVQDACACDIFLETIVEDLHVKQELVKKIHAIKKDKFWFTSNTSAIPISSIISAAQKDIHAMGLHFFSPVHRMKLLEVVKTPTTSPEMLHWANTYATAIGKTHIIVKDSPGFYTTRILSTYLDEALRLFLAGAKITDVDEAVKKAGFPVGPFTLMDAFGVDVAAKASKTVSAIIPERLTHIGVFDTMLKKGLLGKKSKKGFYLYANGAKQVNPDIESLRMGRDETLEPTEFGNLCKNAMKQEAIRCLEDSILESPQFGDIGATLGLGYPAPGPFSEPADEGT